MPKNIEIPEPKPNLPFIDSHCHLPFPRPKKNDKLPSDEDQLNDYFEMGGLYLVTSSIDLETMKMTLDFMEKVDKNYGFTIGWAPQTVTYTSRNKYNEKWEEWIEYVLQNPEKYLAIGEVGLDFHHAKTLEKRKKQVEELEKIFEKTKDIGKPYTLHVRNPAPHEYDKENSNHKFNQPDGATTEILRILDDYKIDPNRVMFHCFSGPREYGISLPEKGFTLSVPSSAYGYKNWRENTKGSPIEALVTETDSYYQHPYKRGPFNVPANARYSIAAIAYTHEVSQEEVAEKTTQNAIEFFDLSIK
jgi:TatD DNase family protein